TIRGGGGVFFDWLDAQTYEQAVQLDGSHQRVETTLEPGYPDPALGGRAFALPPGRVQFAAGPAQPPQGERLIGVEQQTSGTSGLNAMYIQRAGVPQLRGVNINAPGADGRRPDPSAGTITEVQSTAASTMNGLSLNFNYMQPTRRIFVAA